MRSFLFTISLFLLMAHNVVPHHHSGEKLVEHHHDMGHDEDGDDDDEGFAFVLANIVHNPSSEKIIHSPTTSEIKDSNSKAGDDSPFVKSYFVTGLLANPPDIPVLLASYQLYFTFHSTPFLRGPPAI